MILVIDDDIAVRTSLSLLLKKEGFEAGTAGSPDEALELLHDGAPELVLLDMNFSNATTGDDGLRLLEIIKARFPVLPVILITGWATIDLAVRGMKLGAADFIHKPWQNAHLMEAVRTILKLTDGGSGMRDQLRVPASNRKNLDQEFDFGAIIGEDPQMVQILETIGRVAATDASVLILGESGTGKELIAEAIHQNSHRSKRPFVKVNLGGISSGLFESEMFGHVRGAFTDARADRTGRFETAARGTIFLDEIGDLEPASQVKLLRVLQDRTFEVLGSSRAKTVDVRVICATNKNLEELVQENRFREDLLYRINLITIRIPALRERSGDIPLLVDHFLKNLSELYQRPLHIERAAMNWLRELPLPGNVRQLKNLVERVVLMSPTDTLDIGAFQQQHRPSALRPDAGLPEVGALTLEQMEIQMIRRAMAFHKGKIARVARSLGLTRSALYRRLDKFDIPYDPS